MANADSIYMIRVQRGSGYSYTVAYNIIGEGQLHTRISLTFHDSNNNKLSPCTRIKPFLNQLTHEKPQRANRLTKLTKLLQNVSGRHSPQAMHVQKRSMVISDFQCASDDTFALYSYCRHTCHALLMLLL
jgi:hypothetical protein